MTTVKRWQHALRIAIRVWVRQSGPRAVVRTAASALLAAACIPAWAQATGSVPEPTYLVRDNTLGIHPKNLAEPEEAKAAIEGAYAQVPWTYWPLSGPASIYYCTAQAETFRKSDFLAENPPQSLSQLTPSKPIIRYVGGCGGWTQIPNGITYCSTPACVVDPSSHWYKMRATCPHGWVFIGGANPRCDCPAPWTLQQSADGSWGCELECTGNPLDRADCHVQDQSCPANNPVQPGIAVKVQTEVDYEGAGAHALSFSRTFRSIGVRPYVPAGGWSHWTHNWGSRIEVYPGVGRPGRAWLVRGDSSQLIYDTAGNGQWTAWQAGNRNRLLEDRNSSGQRVGFRLMVWADDSVEHYSAEGRLLRIVARNGWTYTLTYSSSSTPASVAPQPGLLIAVRNHFGRELRFTYDSASRLAEVLPPGAISGAAAGGASSPIRYQHEEAASLGPGVGAARQLTSVLWQDGHLRRYHYEHAVRPGLVTGITDELGVRIATYVYHASGRVARTEGPGGSNVVVYAHQGGSTNVIDYSSGNPQTTTYTWQQAQGVVRPIAVSAPCPTCGTTQARTSYTPTGEVARSVAHDGRITFFSYDSKGRETQRAVFPATYNTATTRPALTAAESVTTTQWHSSRRLPLQRAEPGSIQWWTYDSKGNMLTQRRQTTTDANGATGLAATRTGGASGSDRRWTSKGLLASTAEVVDGAAVRNWTYTYNALGDLTRVAGSEAGISETADITVTAQGHWLRIAASNGALATFDHGVRGGLVAAQLPGVGLALTRDARNAVRRIEADNGSWLEIEYDTAGNPIRLLDSGGASTPIASSSQLAEPSRTSVATSHPSGALRQMLQAHAPLPAAPVQMLPAQVISRLLAQGTGVPPAQVRPGDPTERGGPVGCCGVGPTVPSFDFRQDVDHYMVPPVLISIAAALVVDRIADQILIFTSARKLRRNMACHGITKPETGCCHAHHIVHRNGYAKDAVRESQAILAAAGIDIDDWENGVYVECSKHNDTKNPDYDEAVRNRLRAIPSSNRTRAAVGAALRELAVQWGGGC